MSGPSEKDRELNGYLRGDSPLSRAYKKEARELPPAHLDAQILAEAHRADAAPERRAVGSPFSGRWMVPASVTAVVVLAISVAVLLPQGRPGYERHRDLSSDSVAPEAGTSGAGRVEGYEAKQAPAAEYAPSPPTALESDRARSKASSPPASRSAPARQAAPALEQETVLPKEQQMVAPATAAQPDAGESDESLRKRAGSRSEMRTMGDEGAAGRTEAPADPGAWLARIEMLIDRGELDAARQLLAQFRRTYPQAEVPQRLVQALQGEEY